MKQNRPVNVIVHHPKSEEAKATLARRVAEVHADTVSARIKDLNCPASQKQQLITAVIATVQHDAEQ